MQSPCQDFPPELPDESAHGVRRRLVGVQRVKVHERFEKMPYCFCRRPYLFPAFRTRRMVDVRAAQRGTAGKVDVRLAAAAGTRLFHGTVRVMAQQLAERNGRASSRVGKAAAEAVRLYIVVFLARNDAV